jgi:hypothetical protein
MSIAPSSLHDTQLLSTAFEQLTRSHGSQKSFLFLLSVGFGDGDTPLVGLVGERGILMN